MNRVTPLAEQPTESSHSLIKRLIAAGFIAVILFGNLWMSYFLFQSEPPQWIQWGFYLGVFVALTSGLVGAIEFLINFYQSLSGRDD